MTLARLLIVEATGQEGPILARALSSEGHLAKVVANGTAALREVCSEEPPDLVLLDLDLADMDGLKAIERIKAIRKSEFLPVIALAQDEGREARVRALRGGADDVVAWRCEEEELAARIAALLRIRAAQDQLQRTNQELERKSVTDPLTGLFNRRYFEYQLEQELERSRRRGDPVSLLLLDLDRFKRINDRYGHNAGDEVLKAVAQILRGALRRLDVCARWGGEEFAAIMPNTPFAGVEVVCQRILRTVRSNAAVFATPLDGPKGRREPLHFTASLGIAVHSPSGASSIGELFRRADVALYRAKREGRDRACLAEDFGENEGPMLGAPGRGLDCPILRAAGTGRDA